MWFQPRFSETAQNPKKSSEVPKNVDFQWGFKIPLARRVRLNATLYKPKSGDPTPAIFTLTPYIGDSYHPRAVYFAQHGYAFALVDCRGAATPRGCLSRS